MEEGKEKGSRTRKQCVYMPLNSIFVSYGVVMNSGDNTQNVSLEETDRLGMRCDAIRHHTLTNLVLVRCWVSFDQVLQLRQIMRELVSVSSRHFVDSHTWALPLAYKQLPIFSRWCAWIRTIYIQW